MAMMLEPPRFGACRNCLPIGTRRGCCASSTSEGSCVKLQDEYHRLYIDDSALQRVRRPSSLDFPLRCVRFSYCETYSAMLRTLRLARLSSAPRPVRSFSTHSAAMAPLRIGFVPGKRVITHSTHPANGNRTLLHPTRVREETLWPRCEAHPLPQRYRPHGHRSAVQRDRHWCWSYRRLDSGTGKSTGS